jgi:hypothetical protein
MDQSFKNEDKVCYMKHDIYMNDVVMEEMEEMEERWEDNPNVQIERSKNPNHEKEIMKIHLRKLHVQKKFSETT